MFSPEPIGHIRSPYQNTQQVPKGLGAQHAAEGILDILPQYEAGLTDIEGFSHLIVLWVFDRAGGFELLGTPALRQSSARSVRHAFSAASESDRTHDR
jgi:tRNA (Thr-GGU) A37 N-methylase